MYKKIAGKWVEVETPSIKMTVNIPFKDIPLHISNGRNTILKDVTADGFSMMHSQVIAEAHLIEQTKTIFTTGASVVRISFDIDPANIANITSLIVRSMDDRARGLDFRLLVANGDTIPTHVVAEANLEGYKRPPRLSGTRTSIMTNVKNHSEYVTISNVKFELLQRDKANPVWKESDEQYIKINGHWVLSEKPAPITRAFSSGLNKGFK